MDDMVEELRPTSEQRAIAREALRSKMRAVGAPRARESRTKSRVLEIRRMRGLTQIRLAAVIGTNVETVRKAERGYLAQLRTSTVIRFAVALGVGPADLWPVLGARLRKK